MYMMRNKKEVIMKLGTKIIGDFGAMIPLWEGEIVTIDSTYGSALEEAKIKWDNGSHSWLSLNAINSAPTANGSSIGYYREEAYYE